MAFGYYGDWLASEVGCVAVAVTHCATATAVHVFVTCPDDTNPTSREFLAHSCAVSRGGHGKHDGALGGLYEVSGSQAVDLLVAVPMRVGVRVCVYGAT